MKLIRTDGRTWQSPIGTLTVYEHNNCIIAIDFGNPDCMKTSDSPLLREAQRQITDYMEGKLQKFDLPYDLSCGTVFQRKVWQTLSEIPYGETATYSDIAERIGNPLAVRAVGMANHCNPLPIIIPCHRVIGKNGMLTGYAGGLTIKNFLLELERKGLEGTLP